MILDMNFKVFFKIHNEKLSYPEECGITEVLLYSNKKLITNSITVMIYIHNCLNYHALRLIHSQIIFRCPYLVNIGLSDLAIAIHLYAPPSDLFVFLMKSSLYICRNSISYSKWTK